VSPLNRKARNFLLFLAFIVLRKKIEKNNTLMIPFLNALIVDDELSGRENLKTLIETYCTEIKVAGTASSAVDAKQMVIQLSPE